MQGGAWGSRPGGQGSALPSRPACPPQGIPAPPIPGPAVGMLTPHHCPLAALPGPRWRAALSPHIHVCGPGWHLPWPPPRSGACWPAPWGDPTPRWPAVLCMFTEAAGLGSGCFLGLQAPLSPIVCSEQGKEEGQAPQSPRQPWSLEGPGGGWDQDCRFSAPCPSCRSLWQGVLGTLACPVCPLVPGLPSTPRDPGHSKGGGHRCDHPWLQSQCPGKKEGTQIPLPLRAPCSSFISPRPHT